MKKITRYEAIDGKVFNSELACTQYEKIATQVVTFLDSLPLKGVNNGDGYIQHVIGTKQKVEEVILILSNEWWPNEDYNRLSYALGRMIDDSKMRCLNVLVNIYMSIDPSEKQWNQPYFANNPEKGVQKQLN